MNIQILEAERNGLRDKYNSNDFSLSKPNNNSYKLPDIHNAGDPQDIKVLKQELTEVRELAVKFRNYST